ncbi:MAG: hypothetical protein ACTSRG_16115 [Candidatus Helarchaeota archaeon]
MLEEGSESKPCFYIMDDIERIRRNFLDKRFIQEKHPSKGAIICFVYSLGSVKRLHVRIFEEAEGRYIVYGHTEPHPHVDPIFHIKGAILGNEGVQHGLNIAFTITKVAAGILEHLKPKKENGDEKISDEERKKIENIETFQKVSNALPYLPGKKKELADYDEGCKILRDFFPEYTK